MWIRGLPLWLNCTKITNLVTQLSLFQQHTESYPSMLGAGVTYQYPTVDKSPNCIMGLNGCVVQVIYRYVYNIKESAQIFCFAYNVLNMRMGL